MEKEVTISKKMWWSKKIIFVLIILATWALVYFMNLNGLLKGFIGQEETELEDLEIADAEELVEEIEEVEENVEETTQESNLPSDLKSLKARRDQLNLQIQTAEKQGKKENADVLRILLNEVNTKINNLPKDLLRGVSAIHYLDENEKAILKQLETSNNYEELNKLIEKLKTNEQELITKQETAKTNNNKDQEIQFAIEIEKLRAKLQALNTFY